MMARRDQVILAGAAIKFALGVALAASLASCGPRHDASGSPAPGGAASDAERAYRAAPAALAATLLADGRIQIAGQARPGARIRLATPSGQAVFADTATDGGWTVTLPPASTLRLFGLSMIEGGRNLQSEGYLAVTPRGHAAQLRAGAGALVLTTGPARLRFLAVDFDRKGGTVVSAQASPGAMVTLRVDGVPRGRLAAGADGRVSMALDEPLAAGPHRFEIADGRARAQLACDMSPAGPMVGGPFRASRSPGGWRIDWMTPGGGVQTTLRITAVEGG
jgi:hypothetical protein